MPITIPPGYRAAAIGVTSAALLIGAFGIGASRGTAGTAGRGDPATLTAASAGPGRITVTGTGTVAGVPNQLVLSMTVQVNAASVSSALSQADRVVRQVTAALVADRVAGRDIQTSDLSISPNYQGNSLVPVSYGVSESLTVTLSRLGLAGQQIDAAVRAGGNAVTVDDVALNLTDTGKLMAAARARAVADARDKAAQFARALGTPLGPVISLTPTQSSVQPLPFANAASSAAKASVPISPGTQQVSVSITVVYAA